MTGEETLVFLKEKGLKLVEVFVPHQPLLYVHEDMYRGDGDDAPFKLLPADKRPSIARVNDPAYLDFTKVRTYDERSIYDLHNNGGLVEHFVIDPTTKEAVVVKTEYKSKDYQIRRERLFIADETLLPLPKENIESNSDIDTN